MIDEAKLRELTAGATAGPWRKELAVGGCSAVILDGTGYLFGQIDDHQNAAFIAAAREAVPALLAEVDRLRAALRGLYDAGTPIEPAVCDDPEHNHNRDEAEEAVRAYLVARAIAKGALER